MSQSGAQPAPPRPTAESDTDLSDRAGQQSPDPRYHSPSLRATVIFLVATALLAGIAYPAVLAGFAAVVAPVSAAGGPVLEQNGTAVASALIGQNITNDSLFWLRPSLTDYNATVGSGESPFGPTDPALQNLTRYYIRLYGLGNTTAPLEIISNSESGFDPDVAPAGVLAQVPRVAAHTQLSQSSLTALVEAHITPPLLGFLGAPYVDVITLDLDLLAILYPAAR
jgi:potassium-transporting ATPase KdpC subunit